MGTGFSFDLLSEVARNMRGRLETSAIMTMLGAITGKDRATGDSTI
jgi:hypothetical protein